MYCVVGTKIYDPEPNKEGVHVRYDLMKKDSGELYLKRTTTGLKKIPVQSIRCTWPEIKAKFGVNASSDPSEK